MQLGQCARQSGHGRFRRDRGAVRDVLLDLGLDGAHQRLDFQAVGQDRKSVV